MRRFILILMIFSLLLVPFSAQAAEPAGIPGNESSVSAEAGYTPTDAPAITAASGIVMDLDTGDILYEKDCHRKSEPASTTKLMTALLTVDHLAPTDTTTVKDGALLGISYDAVTIGLSPGETMSVGDLLHAMLLPSANDAANVLAMAVSGTIASFATEMNATAEALGCKETHFTNPNGLPDPQHYTTAYDMALIARAAYNRSRIRDIIRTEVYWIPATNMAEKRELWTTNYLLYDVTDVYYEDCTGGKTGYTEEAGYTMVAFAEKNGRRLVSVVFQCPTSDDRFRDAAALLRFGLNEYHKIRPMEGFRLSEAEGAESIILDNYYTRLPHSLPEFSVDTSISIYTRNTVSAEDIEKKVSFNANRTGSTVGEVTLSYHGQDLASIPILSEKIELGEELTPENADERLNPSTTEKAPTKGEILQKVMKESLPQILIGLTLAILLCISTILIVHFRRKRRVNISRYFGDGPVPAVDPEAVAAAEEKKRQREILRQMEDTGETPPRPKLDPAEKHPTDDGIVDTGESAPKKKDDTAPKHPTDDGIEDSGVSAPRKKPEKTTEEKKEPASDKAKKKDVDDIVDEG